ncbi:DUF2653 family protein [Sporosarcina sp. 179-K 3D1 HS]|uniref:DUF2653 family protein n=1 Tax=Sporosarcina sp. 179-K 3D1 HS TaxID=3232169 RepID=UPI00399F3C29
MEKLIIPEQDIINAVCVLMSRKEFMEPEDIEVELLYDDVNGYYAEAFANGVKHNLQTYHLIEALRSWLKDFLNIDPFAAGIQLQIDEEQGMIAVIH